MIPCCPNCESSEAKDLGTIDSTDFYQCYDCGMEYSHIDDEYYNDDDEDGIIVFDMSDDAQALASAGFGTDEDYGLFNDWCD